METTVWVRDVPLGSKTLTLIAGPCAVDTRAQAQAAVALARSAGATLFSAGRRACSGQAGLDLLREIRSELPVLVEVDQVETAQQVAAHADMIRVGAAASAELLHAVAHTGRPVLLDRAPGMSIVDWTRLADRLAALGAPGVVLCEPAGAQGLDISTVPLARRHSPRPVVVAPSSCGHRDLVLPLTRAAIAAGADGVLVDVHPRPESAWCHGRQALRESDLPELVEAVQDLAPAVGRLPASLLATQRLRTA